MRHIILLVIILFLSSCDKRELELSHIYTNKICFDYMDNIPVCVSSEIDTTVNIYGLYLSKINIFNGKSVLVDDVLDMVLTDMFVVKLSDNRSILLSNDSSYIKATVDSISYNELNIGDYIYVVTPVELLKNGSYMVSVRINSGIEKTEPIGTSVEMDLSE